ncbi:hypothetical protein ACWC24_33830 [Streptomyces sp. NPDC001443]
MNHPDWDRAELLARDDGHFVGPGLSWPDLLAAADNGPPGGTTTDPHARLGVQAAVPLATAMLEVQGLTGPVRWTAAEDGTRINDGGYSLRNPDNDFALPGDRLAGVSAALAG